MGKKQLEVFYPYFLILPGMILAKSHKANHLYQNGTIDYLIYVLSAI